LLFRRKLCHPLFFHAFRLSLREKDYSGLSRAARLPLYWINAYSLIDIYSNDLKPPVKGKPEAIIGNFDARLGGIRAEGGTRLNTWTDLYGRSRGLSSQPHIYIKSLLYINMSQTPPNRPVHFSTGAFPCINPSPLSITQAPNNLLRDDISE
jgi:hypothetical protein